MKGICFKERLFQLTIEKVKIQTRRIMVPQPDDGGVHNHTLLPMSVDSDLTGFWGTVEETGEFKEFKPRYKVGEIVYLKEPYFDYRVRGISDRNPAYKYDRDEETERNIKWENKLFMSEKYARYFIQITDVRAERLQDISDADCIKEGIIPVQADERVVYQWHEITIGPRSAWCLTPQQAYACLIDSINGFGTWDSNSFVWVYDYELVEH